MPTRWSNLQNGANGATMVTSTSTAGRAPRRQGGTDGGALAGLVEGMVLTQGGGGQDEDPIDDSD